MDLFNEINEEIERAKKVATCGTVLTIKRETLEQLLKQHKDLKQRWFPLDVFYMDDDDERTYTVGNWEPT